MSSVKKALIAIVVVVAILAMVGYAVATRNRGLLAVEAGVVIVQDIVQSVTANGEVKPLRYVNIGADVMGRITDMPVAEGDQVAQGDFLLQIESIQNEADVQSAQASLDAALAELEGMEASIRSAEASLFSAEVDKRRLEADFQLSQQEFDRARNLFEAELLSREQFQRQESAFEVAQVQLESADARIAQADAQRAQVLQQREGTRLRIGQQQAALTRARDGLEKTRRTAPLSGVITYLPVNVGEIAIVGLQNQPGTTLMTIADMSEITAEVLVDETDIVSLRLNQRAEVRVDALGEQILSGYVSEIGSSALTAGGNGGISTTTTNTDEAKDFRVVITLDNPPDGLRPGLSCTATIETAREVETLSVPIQAITIREIDGNAVPDYVTNAVYNEPRPGEDLLAEVEGVFVIEGGLARFRPVQTGIVGTTDIEILAGLSESDQLVIGPYRVLRTLEDETAIRIQEAEEEDDES
jgi:HlyD family secretion protein